MKIAAVILSFSALVFAQLTGPLPNFTADMDYFCYYGGFGPAEVQQAQYFDMIIVGGDRLSADQAEDIRNGFDDIMGTEDDVLVFGYLSMGEAGYSTMVGDGSGPVYFNGVDTVYEHSGLASYYLDDEDHNGVPDQNGFWNSYYVNAGDPAWWEANSVYVDEMLLTKQLDGIFMDTMGVPFPATWGGFYEWTTEGMANYVAYLRAHYPDKYLFGNNPSIYMAPFLPGYAYMDVIRNSINAYMYESYYLSWDVDLGVGYVSPWFEGARDTWAPLINTEAIKTDGFTPVALDYVTVEQSNYETLMAEQIQVTEVDQNWLTAVSWVWLNEMRYDTYHRHPVDNNSPTWPGMPGIQYYSVNGADVTLYWNSAVDLTLPISYHLYFAPEAPDFNGNAGFELVVPGPSEYFDFEYTIHNVALDVDYYAVLRSSDGAAEPHMDQNRVVYRVSTDPDSPGAFIMDGIFNDWANLDNIDETEFIGDAPVAACDILDIWVAVDAEALHFSCSFAEVPALESYFYHMFIDTDENIETGFHYGGSRLGADFMVENRSLFRYTGSNGSWSWEWAGTVSLELGVLESNRFEASVQLAELQMTGNRLALMFNVNDNADLGPDDFAPNTYTEDSYFCNLMPESIHEPLLPQSPMVSVFPNPFNSTVTFDIMHYSGSGESGLLQIYDIQGKLVRQFEIPAGRSGVIQWDGLDKYQQNIESGLYIYRLKESKPREGQTFSSGKLLALK